MSDAIHKITEKTLEQASQTSGSKQSASLDDAHAFASEMKAGTANSTSSVTQGPASVQLNASTNPTQHTGFGEKLTGALQDAQKSFNETRTQAFESLNPTASGDMPTQKDILLATQKFQESNLHMEAMTKVASKTAENVNTLAHNQ